jgi:DNA-directed RNA polymerase sigma subunit (sigma70/sigma32)
MNAHKNQKGDAESLSEKTSKQRVLSDQADDMLRRVLCTLTPREEFILRWRLRINPEWYQKKGIATVEDMAAYHNIDVEALLRYERRAILKLRAPVRAQRFRGVDTDPRTFFAPPTDRAAERHRIQSVERVEPP